MKNKQLIELLLALPLDANVVFDVNTEGQVFDIESVSLKSFALNNENLIVLEQGYEMHDAHNFR